MDEAINFKGDVKSPAGSKSTLAAKSPVFFAWTLDEAASSSSSSSTAVPAPSAYQQEEDDDADEEAMVEQVEEQAELERGHWTGIDEEEEDEEALDERVNEAVEAGLAQYKAGESVPIVGINTDDSRNEFGFGDRSAPASEWISEYEANNAKMITSAPTRHVAGISQKVKEVSPTFYAWPTSGSAEQGPTKKLVPFISGTEHADNFIHHRSTKTPSAAPPVTREAPYGVWQSAGMSSSKWQSEYDLVYRYIPPSDLTPVQDGAPQAGAFRSATGAGTEREENEAAQEAVEDEDDYVFVSAPLDYAAPPPPVIAQKKPKSMRFQTEHRESFRWPVNSKKGSSYKPSTVTSIHDTATPAATSSNERLLSKRDYVRGGEVSEAHSAYVWPMSTSSSRVVTPLAKSNMSDPLMLVHVDKEPAQSYLAAEGTYDEAALSLDSLDVGIAETLADTISTQREGGGNSNAMMMPLVDDEADADELDQHQLGGGEEQTANSTMTGHSAARRWTSQTASVLRPKNGHEGSLRIVGKRIARPTTTPAALLVPVKKSSKTNVVRLGRKSSKSNNHETARVMVKRYPICSDKQNGRWQSESKSQFVWKRKNE